MSSTRSTCCRPRSGRWPDRQGMASSRAEKRFAVIERTGIPFVRTRRAGRHARRSPAVAGAARTLALQQADVVFLMGARFNWILHFGLPPLSEGRQGHRPTSRRSRCAEQAGRRAAPGRRQGDRQAQPGAFRRSGSHRGSSWRQALAQKAKKRRRDHSAVGDESSPGGYYRLFRDIRSGCRRTSCCAARATTMDIGGTQMPLENARSYMNAGSYGDGRRPRPRHRGVRRAPGPPGRHVSGDSAIGFSGMEMERCAAMAAGQDRRAQQWQHQPGDAGNSKTRCSTCGRTPHLRRPLRQMMQSFGGYGAYVEDTKDVRGAHEP